MLTEQPELPMPNQILSLSMIHCTIQVPPVSLHERERRWIMPKTLLLYGNSSFLKSFCDFSKIEKLKLGSLTYAINLRCYGKQLTSLRKLVIIHHAKQRSIFKATQYMPENKVLEVFKHHKEQFTCQRNIGYYVSYIIKEWDPSKSKLCKIELDAKFTYDIKVEEVLDKRGEAKERLVCTKYPNDEEIKKKLKRMEIIEHNTESKYFGILLQDKKTGHMLYIKQCPQTAPHDNESKR